MRETMNKFKKSTGSRKNHKRHLSRSGDKKKEPAGKKICKSSPPATDFFLTHRCATGHSLGNTLYYGLLWKGQDVFYDLESLPAGVNLNDTLMSAVSNSKNVILIMTENWKPRRPGTDFLFLELETALANHCKIFPVFTRDENLVTAEEAASDPVLAAIQALVAVKYEGNNPAHAINRLIQDRQL